VNAKHLIEYRLFLYESIEAVHVIAVISWMAGMLYLPRQVMPAPFLTISLRSPRRSTMSASPSDA
jgi:uncharacterized membrane protein